MSNGLIGIRSDLNDANALKSHINSDNSNIFLTHLISSGSTKKRYEYWNNTQVEDEDTEKFLISPEVVNQIDYINSLGAEILSRNILLSREANPTPNRYDVVPANFFKTDFRNQVRELNDFIDSDTFVFTEEMKRHAYRAYNKWNSIITSLPDNATDPSRQILTINYFQSLGANTLGSVMTDATSYSSEEPELASTQIFKKYAKTGYNVSNIHKYNDYIADPELFYHIQLHEIGHILGIGTLWHVDGSLKDTPQGNSLLLKDQNDSDGNLHDLYTGAKALDVYKYYNADGTAMPDKNYINNDYSDVSQCVGIPLEDYGSSGTNGKHPEEGNRFNDTGHQISDNNITIDGVYYPGLGHELTTGFFDGSNQMPLSAISIGFLEDMGYGVDYSKADEYILGTGANNVLECVTSITFLQIVETNSGKKYVLNNETTYNKDLQYGFGKGTYIIKNVPETHPMAILNNGKTDKITYSGDDNNKNEAVEILNSTADGIYDFYYGDITVTVLEDFDDISIYCQFHRYMGGENLFRYAEACQLDDPINLVSGIVPNWMQPEYYDSNSQLFQSGKVTTTVNPGDIRNSNLAYSNKGITSLNPFRSWCAPTAAACMLGHLNNNYTLPLNVNILGDGFKAEETLASSTIIWDSGNGWGDYLLDGPNNRETVGANPTINTDFGFYMNTNNVGRDGTNGNSPNGTLTINIFQGLKTFFEGFGVTESFNQPIVGIVNINPLSRQGKMPDYWQGKALFILIQEIETEIFNTIKHEIDNNRTVLGCFKYWSLTPSALGSFPTQDKTIHFYDIAENVDVNEETGEEYKFENLDNNNSLGHTVCIIGYILADSNHNTNWIIVRDNQFSTEPYVAIPFNGTDSGNSTEGFSNLIACIFVNPDDATQQPPSVTNTIVASYIDNNLRITTESLNDDILNIAKNLKRTYDYVNDLNVNLDNNTITVQLGNYNKDLDISSCIEEFDSYYSSDINDPDPNDDTTVRRLRCEVTVDGYIKRKDFFVKSLGNAIPYFGFYENTFNSIHDDIEGNQIENLDLNYEAEYRFVGAGAQSLQNYPFKIGVYPDTNTTDILRLIKLSNGDSPVSGDGLHTMRANKEFIDNTDADKLSCMLGTEIDTLEWYDEDGNLLDNQSGSDIRISAADTKSKPNRITIKLKYRPLNYLGHKTTSRLFYRCETNKSLNNQILISTPHNVVKIFDYSLLDNKYRKDTATNTTLFNGGEKITSDMESGQSLLEYDPDIRIFFIRAIQRIERLMVFSDETLKKRKQEIDDNTIFSGDSIYGDNYGNKRYKNSNVGLFEGQHLWKGMYMEQFNTYTNSKIGAVASAFNVSEFHGRSHSFGVDINRFRYDGSLPSGKDDVITHELFHGLGIIPSRKVYTDSSKTNQILPKTTTETMGAGIINIGPDPIFEGNDVAFYPNDTYPELCAKYKEYTDSVTWTDWTGLYDEITEVNNIQDGSKVPLENFGGESTSGAHFERFGFFNDNGEIGSNTQFYLGAGNELMIGYIIRGFPTIITGLTIGAAKAVIENDGVKVFKTFRDDGEVVPFNATNEEMDTIPWHKSPNRVIEPINFDRTRYNGNLDSFTGKTTSQFLEFNRFTNISQSSINGINAISRIEAETNDLPSRHMCNCGFGFNLPKIIFNEN